MDFEQCRLLLGQTWGGMAGLAVLSFFIGAIPFGYFAGKLKGIDIRQHGSGNIGATNVFRVMGPKWGLPVFFLDALKGALPTLVALWAGQGSPLISAEILAGIVGVLSILGHSFTPFLGWKGGKGVATGCGMMIALLPIPFAAAFVVAMIVFAITRTISIMSLIAALTLATTTTFLHHETKVLVVLAWLIFAFLVYTHRSNIQRLMAGTENKFGKKS